jgi:hypothetical protein
MSMHRRCRRYAKPGDKRGHQHRKEEACDAHPASLCRPAFTVHEAMQAREFFHWSSRK